VDAKGGAERAIIGLANYFKNIGYDIAFLVERGHLEQAAYPLNEDIAYYIANERESSNPIIRRLQKFKSIRRIVYSDIKPDVIVSFLAISNIRMLIAMRGCNIPIIVCERNNPKTDPEQKIKRIIRDALYKKAIKIIVQTEDAKSYFSWKLQNKTSVIPNYLDSTSMPDRFNGARQKVIVTAGRLTSQKNHSLLIDAFAKTGLANRGYKLVIYGNGELRETLNNKIENLGLANAIELHVAISDLHQRINNAACFVLSSDYEGMPNALMEAMGLGLPCVSTDCPCGGPRFLITNNVNGTLVPINNCEALTKAINRMVEDKSFSELCSKNAYEIRNSLSIDKVFHLWEKVLLGDG
jgi:glycosyltransferase involved in cell wall biosynthesis